MTSKKRWTRLDEEKRLCGLWLKEPLINPETGHSIERNGPTYLDWKERCKEIGMINKPVATKSISWRKCQEWRRHPDINPDTGRKINRGGPTWKWLAEQCKLVEEKELSLEGEYYIPDTKGMVPCVIDRGIMYVIRKHADRKVWGPLNKPAKGIKLCYYTETWDYRYNHYRPVFVDGPPPKKPTPVKKLSVRITNKPKDDPKYMIDNVIDLFIKK